MSLYHDGHEFDSVGGTCLHCYLPMATWWDTVAEKRMVCLYSALGARVSASGHSFDVTGQCRRCGSNLHHFASNRPFPTCNAAAPSGETLVGQQRHGQQHPSEEFDAIRAARDKILKDEASARRDAEEAERNETGQYVPGL